jgi:hypothetical protein
LFAAALLAALLTGVVGEETAAALPKGLFVAAVGVEVTLANGLFIDEQPINSAHTTV